jgi:CHRD domain
MKKILLTVMTAFLVTLVACNDSGTKTTDETAKTDSPAVASDNSVAATSNIMTKTGLPLRPDQEVPSNNSPATGTADVTYNKDTKMLTYTLSWNGLTDKPTMAHIHGVAARGTNAGVKHDLSNVLKKEITGSFTDSVKIDASDIKEDSLLSGFYYFNIHTKANPGGEIRGQIEFK